jgi:excisionase family DNA binding protein
VPGSSLTLRCSTRDGSSAFGEQLVEIAGRRTANDEFLTVVAEVAAILKLRQQTIRDLITEGLLAALRVGRRVTDLAGAVRRREPPSTGCSSVV